MSEKQVLKPVSVAVGSALAGAFVFSAAANADTGVSPFSVTTLGAGYLLGAQEAEGSCGEGKCGGDKGDEAKDAAEGSCGGDKEAAEGSCGGDKEAAEGSCGGDKEAAEGSCGGDKEAAEGSCGGDKEAAEGSCGGDKETN